MKYVMNAEFNRLIPKNLTEKEEIEKWISENPQVDKFDYDGNFPAYVDAHKLSGVMKVPSDFNNLLKKIHKNNAGSKIQTGNITEV